MFLLRLLDLMALIGLFVQAFVAWIFVALLAAIRRREGSGAFRTFLGAFAALAVALTVMSVRFFRSHDVESSYTLWADGSPLVIACYSAYTALKATFGLLLARGSMQLGGVDEPRWFRRLLWPLVAVAAAVPIVEHDVSNLLVAQAPVMIGCSLLSLHALRRRRAETGLSIVRWSLIGLAASWTVHALAVFGRERPGMHELLSFNSFVDLGVQLTLGVGLVVSLLQDTHRKLIEAEQERERMAREMEKSEKLRALGTVVSGVAHELNNPLTVILAYAEELREIASTRRAATIVAEQAERCRGIVRNLSALAGQSVHPREDLDLEALVERVVRGIAADKARDGGRVRVLPLGGLRIAADRIGIEQVLSNLIANGLDAGPVGTVTVSALTQPGSIELRVADEGPGVPEELRERIFEPFFTTKGPGRGTGLGLSIAHGIVRGHGGSLTVDDRDDGPGAVFRVRLPHVSVAPPSVRAPATRRSGGRLLVVDDEPAVRDVVCKQAERRGWEVDEAASAEDALRAPLSEYDAILCDLRMPGIGGAGFRDRLRAERPELLDRTVFVTGDLASDHVRDFARSCARPLLYKPFEAAELFERLERAAEGSASGSEPAAVEPGSRSRVIEPGALPSSVRGSVLREHGTYDPA